MTGLALAMVLTGCGGASPATAPPTPTDAASPAEPTARPAIGRPAIRVDGVDAATGTLRFTDAMIFSDEEAHRAAREDGQPGGAPNPVWIRDLATGGALPIDLGARVVLIGHDAAGDVVPKPATVATLVRVLGGTIPPGEWQGSPYLFVIVDNGRIVSVEEPMLP